MNRKWFVPFFIHVGQKKRKLSLACHFHVFYCSSLFHFSSFTSSPGLHPNMLIQLNDHPRIGIEGRKSLAGNLINFSMVNF